MNREEKFILSHRPYAVDLASLSVSVPGSHGSAWASAEAVWFRRRRAQHNGPLRTVACAGQLRDLMDPPPVNMADFLARSNWSSVGGDCRARWDGETLWAPELTPDRYKAALELLGPALANYPAVPGGYQGWWTFRA